MVRVFLKGGVWTNSEDEVLKAAIQKYGKQQWARVASLLNRKTAKQAKARWYEWLDPQIRKTEWSRDEEEKLLHLAKLLPAQWKTIAPIVGRTATQCQEHYEYLLDQAASSGETGAEELRKQALRPGQIDSHPETKPARPDPIDMDEDEMEMLQEARARLANTQGKKAKRKQREKMLAQAKRLADLQKRRELKQAGLLSKAALKKSKRGKREIDFGVEIPFHKPAPAGFHDTSSEVARTDAIRAKRVKQVDYQQVNENRYRSRDYEEAQRKKKEERRLKILEQATEKYAKQKEEEAPARPRGVLTLPEPTVTDAELQLLAKMQKAQMDASAIAQEGSSVTQALLGDYSDRPLPTPMRTPTVGAGQHRDLVREASQLRELERGQTPLLPGPGYEGDHTTEEQGGEEEDDGKIAAAPTPRLPDRAGAGRTPGSVGQRDQLGLNRPGTALRDGGDSASVGASTFATSNYSIRELARKERQATKRARLELEAALAALPAPQFEYELAAPADVDMDETVQVETVYDEDQADVEARERERLRKEAEKRYEAQSSVLKRPELPRPAKLSQLSIDTVVGDDEARRLIHDEFMTLLGHDAYAHPVLPADHPIVGKTKKKKKRKHAETLKETSPQEVPLDFISEEAIAFARDAIASELSDVMSAIRQPPLDTSAAERFAINAAMEESRKAAALMVYTAKGWRLEPSDAERLESLRLEHSTILEAVEALRAKNDKQEAKLGIVNGGYAKIYDQCNEDILETFADLQNSRIEKSVYEMLQSNERQGGADRVDRLKADIATLKAQETQLQHEYSNLSVEKRRRVIQERSQGLGWLDERMP